MSLEASQQASCRTRLESGLKALGLSATEQQIQQWLGFLGLLLKWNRAYNLTALKDPLEMVDRHLIDSLSVAPYLQSKHLIDVGTGPGLPGIPLAIMFPEKQFSLLDSNGKRTRFLQQVKVELGLDNIQIFHGRAEQHQPQQGYGEVLSRAFASLNDMLQWTHHLCTDQGRFLAMKGQYPADEIESIPTAYQVEQVHPLTLPGSDAERHLVIITKTTV